MALNTTQVKALISVETSGEERMRQLRREMEQLAKETGQLNSVTASGAKSDAIRRQSMIQLGQQMGDVGVQLQMGTSAARVFAMQAGQVGFALAGMGGALGRVGTFLAGPWGAALTIAVSTLGMFIEELASSEEAAKGLELASNGLSDAQGVLGDMFDLTTGKVKANTEALRLNALMVAANLRAEAASAKSSASSAMVNAGQSSWGALWRNDTPLLQMSRVRNTAARQLLLGVQSGAIGSDVAFRRAQNMNFDDVDISRDEYLQAIAFIVTAKAKNATADQIEEALQTGKLPQALMRPARDRPDRKAKQKKPDKPIRESAEFYAAETLGAWRRAWSRNDSDPIAEADITSTIKTEMIDLRSDGEKFLDGSAQAFKDYGKEIADIGSKAFAAWTNAMRATENAFVSFITTGKLSFSDLANSIIADIGRIAVQQAIIKPLTGFLQGLNLFQSANGSAFASGGVRAFASGGVVDSPTMFGYAGGLGVMGEAGAEAIMPLKRLSNGKLGVMSEGGSNNVTVNVNVEGGNTEVMGDQGKAAQLGNIIANAVRNELVVQKRPGGILAAA